MATKTTKSWGLSVPIGWCEIPAEFDGKIKTPRDPAPGSALLSAVARAVAGPGAGAKSWLRHSTMMDLNQLYTVLFCLWFLALGAIEYLVLRWVWRRWFRSNAKPGRARLSGRDCVLFTVGARRQIEGPGEDAGKGLLRIEAILQAIS